MNRHAFGLVLAVLACQVASKTGALGSGDGGNGSGATSDGRGLTEGIASQGDDAGDTVAGTDDGLTDAGGEDSTGGDFHHPPGFAAADVHGAALKLQTEDCRGCHGQDLAGGNTGISCDSCHTPGWRDDCVYCHGAAQDSTGAPPRGLASNDANQLRFSPHHSHVTQTEHAPYDCIECHLKPTDVLSDGHIFDGTPGVAEVDFTAGLSPDGQWDGGGECSNLYCHGNGLDSNGSYHHDDPMPSCGGCHPYPSTPNEQYQGMSGRHSLHMLSGLACNDCHDESAVDEHVNGQPDVAITASGFSFTPDSGSCTGFCHNKFHFFQQW